MVIPRKRMMNDSKGGGKRLRKNYNSGAIARIGRPIREQFLKFKRKVLLENWAPNTITTNGFWRHYVIALNNIQDLAGFQGLFDLYRITGLLFEFHPRYNGFTGEDQTSSTTSRSGCRLHVINDPYTTVQPSGLYNTANLNFFLEQGPCKTYDGSQVVRVFTRPTVNRDMGGYTMIQRAGWIRTDYPAAGHKAINVFAQDNFNFSGIFTQSFDVFVTYYVEFKNMK